MMIQDIGVVIAIVVVSFIFLHAIIILCLWRDKNWNTYWDVRKVLMRDLHFHNCWDAPIRFNPFTLTFHRNAPDDYVSYSLWTGKGYRKDDDFDGCCLDDSFSFTIGDSKNRPGLKAILRER